MGDAVRNSGRQQAALWQPRGRCLEASGFCQQKVSGRTALVAQWLRIRLPTQGTRVRALVWEDLTCRGATKPVRHNY